MTQTRIVKAAGLWTSPSPLSAPLGSYSVADNCVVDRPDIITSRRGFSWLPYAYNASIGSTADQLFSFQGVLLVHTYIEGKWYRDTGISFAAYPGTYNIDDSRRHPQSAEVAQNFYFTADPGINVIDQATTAGGNTPTGIRPAGVQLGPLATSRVTATGVNHSDIPNSGFLGSNSAVAYVATWETLDYHGTPHEGVESAPFFVTSPTDVTFNNGTDATLGFATYGPGSGGNVQIQFPTALRTPVGTYNVGDPVLVSYSASATPFVSGTYTITTVGTVVDSTTGKTYINSIFYAFAGGGTPLNYTAGTGSISSGSKNVTVRIDIPQNGAIASGQYVSIYRSFQVSPATVTPADQYYLVNQHLLTAADLAAGVYTFVDNVPDSALSNPLYDNTQDGDPPDSSPQNDNSQPPPATDVALFDQRLWGACYTEFATYSISLLGTVPGVSLTAGDTITVAGTTYTAVAEGTALTSSTFTVYTSNISAGLNIRLTAQSLALTVAKYDPNVYGYYTSDSASLFQGDLLFRRRVGNSSTVVGVTVTLTVSVSRPAAWSPAGTSTAARQTNGLWFSKQNEPEAVPLLNRLSIGPQNCQIVRIKALRDKLYVFTDIAGVYTVANQYPYQVTLLSRTAFLLGSNTLVSFNDSLYCLTSQGVTKFDETGPTIISIPIEADLKRLYGLGLPTLIRNAVAVGYESYRKFILAMPTDPSDTTNTQAFVYDVVTKAWTRWTKPISAMTVVPQNDLLYATSPLNNKVSQERKLYTRTDYADEDFAVAVQTTGPSSSVTLTSAAGINPGDLLYQDPINNSLVLAVNGNVVTTKDSMSWFPGAGTVYPAIQTSAVYTPMFSGEPEMTKHYREVSFHFLTPAFTQGFAAFFSDLNPAEIDQSIAMGGFGEQTWQLFPWAQPGGPKNKRVTVPTGSQRASYMSVGFTLREAWAQWQLLGYTPTFEQISERGASK